MPDTAIILGSGQTLLKSCEVLESLSQETGYGSPSGPLIRTRLGAQEVFLLARHGTDHSIPPHKINYRANIMSLKKAGVKKIIAVAAVGGISEQMSPGSLVVPDQLIDYTWGREHTFYNGGAEGVEHVDFTEPYSLLLREQLLQAADSGNVCLRNGAVYGAVQGPRLETAQEIRRMAHDGCDLVGMTGMPEASLAREADMEYACCAVVANWAAGVKNGTISMHQIETTLLSAMQQVDALLVRFFSE